jgi:hypothetical protein
MMPQDVSTWANSTYDMLKFAIKYRPAIDAMTAVCELDLRKYELESAEWKIAGELRDVMKVCYGFVFGIFISNAVEQIFTAVCKYNETGVSRVNR